MSRSRCPRLGGDAADSGGASPRRCHRLVVYPGLTFVYDARLLQVVHPRLRRVLLGEQVARDGW